MNKKLLYFFGACWSIALPIGVGYPMIYDSHPGVAGDSPTEIPQSSQLKSENNKFNLVLFLHPLCPCSVATLDNLERLLPELDNRVQVDIFFYKSSLKPENWGKSSLWERSQKLTGVKTHFDIDGVQAAQFKSETSGQAILYDPNGKRVFQGGLTSRRGHSGENVGTSSLVALVNHEGPTKVSTPVFGCSLHRPGKSSPVASSQ